MLHKINNTYVQLEHISSVKLLKDGGLAEFGIETDFGPTLEISLLGHEPIHIICGDLAEAELQNLLKLIELL